MTYGGGVYDALKQPKQRVKHPSFHPTQYFGRQPVLISTYIGHTLFTLACALSPTYVGLIVFRLLCGMNAAAANAILGGLYSDTYHNPQQRGTAMACFMFMTTLGPQVGPTLSGFVSVISWR